MAELRRVREWRSGWWAMGKSVGLVYGVPIGITVGVVVGAILEIVDVTDAAAKALLIGILSGSVLGAVLAWCEIRNRLRWIRREFAPVSSDGWAAIVMAFHVRAAQKHYLLIRREGDYVAYAPTLVRPVAAGPLTVSGEYLSVIVSRLGADAIAITGPKYMVHEFEAVAAEALAE